VAPSQLHDTIGTHCYHFRQHGEHLFAYDEETAHKVLKAAGFVKIGKRDYQPNLDSPHRRIGSLFMSRQSRYLQQAPCQ
jgi:hypothetical protein